MRDTYVKDQIALARMRNSSVSSAAQPSLTPRQQAVVSTVAQQQPTTAAAVASAFTPVSGNQLKSLTGGKQILGVEGSDIFSKNGKLFVQDPQTKRMIRLQEDENGFSRLGQVPLTRLSTGGLVYASGGSLVPQSSPVGKEVQDIKGIELGEYQVAKINNVYPEIKTPTIPALDKILDKQSFSKAADTVSSTTSDINNLIKGINKQTELVGSIGTSGTKEVLAQMSPKSISGSINNSPQYKAGGGIVYASNGTLVAAKSVGTDTVPAMLTPGEFVVNRQATQQHMPILQAINSGAYNQGGVVKYLAEGGIVAPNYYNRGGVASGEGLAALAGMDMSAVKELASSLSGLKDTFGSLENIKSLGDSLQSAVSTMGSNINSFGEHISHIPGQVLHNVSASVTQHVTGLGDAGRDILSQATANANIISQQNVATVVHNLHTNSEGAITGGNPDGPMGRVGHMA